MNSTMFEEKVHLRMFEEHIPGLAVAVEQTGKTIYEKGFGVRDLHTKKPVTPDTIFGTASVTKSFTALAIMQLAFAGKLSVNDSVNTYLPSFTIHGVENIEKVKIHHLLTHTTGLAPMKRREAYDQFQDHLVYLKEEKPELLGKPIEYFSYSNDAFLLLGALIEKVTGRLYRCYITEEILNPLKMNRSTFRIEELNKMCNVSTPYIYNKALKVHEKQAWPKLGNYEVGGGIRSTVRDLLNYGELFLNGGNASDKELIDKTYLASMYHPQVLIDSQIYYGYAFKVTPDYHGRRLVEHSGGQPGVSAHFGFLPDEECSIAVLTNVSGASTDEIWFDIVNRVLDLPLNTRINHFPKKEDAVISGKRFLGEYATNEGDKIIITDHHGELVAHYNGELYFVKIKDKSRLMIADNHQLLRFYFDKNDEAWAVFVGMRMLLKR